MSSLQARWAWPVRPLLMVAVFLGVLTMHGLASADAPIPGHDAMLPGVAAVDREADQHPGESHDDQIGHLGALCLWLVVTGVLALHAVRALERTRRRPTRWASTYGTEATERPMRRSRSPGLLPGVDLLRC
jgi:hypothetical protein